MAETLTLVLRIHAEQVPYPVISEIIALVDRVYSPVGLGVDRGGNGMSVVQELMGLDKFRDRHFAGRLVGYDFGSSIAVGEDERGRPIKKRTKEQMTSLINKALGTHKLVLPEQDHDVEDQLCTQTYVLTDRGVIYSKGSVDEAQPPFRQGSQRETAMTSPMKLGQGRYPRDVRRHRKNGRVAHLVGSRDRLLDDKCEPAICAKSRQFFAPTHVEKTYKISCARFRRIQIARFSIPPSWPGTISDTTATVTMIFARHSPVVACTGEERKPRKGEMVPDLRGELPHTGHVSPYGPVEKSCFQAIRACRSCPLKSAIRAWPDTPDAHGPVQRVNINNCGEFQVIPNGQPTGEHGCARVNQRVVSTGEAPDSNGLRHPHG